MNIIDEIKLAFLYEFKKLEGNNWKPIVQSRLFQELEGNSLKQIVQSRLGLFLFLGAAVRSSGRMRPMANG